MKQVPRNLALAGALFAIITTIYLSVAVLALFGLFGATAGWVSSMGLATAAGPFAFIALILLLLAAAVVLYPWAPIIVGLIGIARKNQRLFTVSAALYAPVVLIFAVISGSSSSDGSLEFLPLLGYVAACGLTTAAAVIAKRDA